MKKQLIKNILFTILFGFIIVDLIVFPILWMNEFRNIEDMNVQQLCGSYIIVEGILAIYISNTTLNMWEKYIKAKKDKQNG